MCTNFGNTCILYTAKKKPKFYFINIITSKNSLLMSAAPIYNYNIAMFGDLDYGDPNIMSRFVIISVPKTKPSKLSITDEMIITLENRGIH
jgi:hypothetical protein